MKKTILIYGIIAGLIVTTMMVISTYFMYNNPNLEHSYVIGYLSMLIAFTFVFLGTKQYRDKQNNGVITFKKAFKVGFFIALIASIMYTLVWLVEYHFFIPDFMDKYSDFVIKDAQNNGLSETELQSKIAEMDKFKEWYKNPILMILLTISEILPLGILVTLISSLVLKRKVAVL